MPRPPASQKAFTLIEVLMAMTVLVVSFTAVIQAVTMGAEMIDTARKQQIAQQIIEGEIAARRNAPWSISALPPVSMKIDDTGNAIDDPGTVFNDPKYFYFTSNNNLPPGNDPNLALRIAAKGFTVEGVGSDIRSSFRSATYTVRWTGITGTVHTRIGTAHFGQNGLHLSYQK